MFFKSIIAAASALAALSTAAPVESSSSSSRVIAGSYIIKLKENVATDSHLQWVSGVHARSLGKEDFAGIQREYKSLAFHGYAGHFDKDTIDKIKNSDEVAYVEEDKTWYLEDTLVERALTTQSDATWGLGAISHREPGATEYVYDDAAGEGTFGYIVDSGVRTTHDEFEGRASTGWTGYQGDEEDTAGHGTHVAGTVGGKTFGVAKKATLIAVKVFQGRSASTSIIMAGFDWAVNDIVNKGRKDKAAINLSLGGPQSQAWNDAIETAFNKGVLSVVAAGNAQVDASTTSPASAPNAFTVGAVNKDWQIVTNWPRGQGSNYGRVLDIFAPGDNIESASNNSDTESRLDSGTSMACPHVTGMALYAMSVNGVTGAKAVTAHLIKNAGQGVVGGPLRGSPNRMANLGN
ncbi:putative serine protease Pr1D [Purpureocillium lavendulum]|uniref:Serine protease Pr1D n=1 Tax=Purpureocillium lavendulum TaxID=1247861 RepID=A0AB34FIV9_9HYPO|nr:putative serine protease Pr1D [Purpureocillium lavendulum]QBS17561.1 putative serine protease Pr1D [Purpureocillium lavendulum]